MSATVTTDPPVGFGVIGVVPLGAFHASTLASRTFSAPSRLIALPSCAVGPRPMSATVTADQPVAIGIGQIGAFHAANLAIRKHGVRCRMIVSPLYALATRS